MLKAKRTLAFSFLPLVFYSIVFITAFGAFYLSLTEWKTLDKFEFVGLENFEWAVGYKRTINSFLVTLIFVAITILALFTVPLLQALILNQASIGADIGKTIFVLPQVVSGVATGLIWAWIFSPTFGPIDSLAEALGLPFLKEIAWLGEPHFAIMSISFAWIWLITGFNTMIYLARLRSIPRDVIEAAQLDGANSFQVFRYITIPYLRIAFAIVIPLGIINAFRLFDQIVAMTWGGPGHSTEVLALLMYKVAFIRFELGHGSAIGVLLFFASLGAAIAYIWSLLRR